MIVFYRFRNITWTLMAESKADETFTADTIDNETLSLNKAEISQSKYGVLRLRLHDTIIKYDSCFGVWNRVKTINSKCRPNIINRDCIHFHTSEYKSSGP